MPAPMVPPGLSSVRTLRSLGIKTPILGTHAFGFGFVIALGGEAMEGVEFAAAKPVVPDQLDEMDPVRPINIDFDRRMQARYGVEADQIAGYAHDVIWLAYDALNRSGEKITRQTFRDALENTRDFKGCHGIYTYSPTDHDGLTKKDLVFVRIQGQRFNRVKFPGLE